MRRMKQLMNDLYTLRIPFEVQYQTRYNIKDETLGKYPQLFSPNSQNCVYDIIGCPGSYGFEDDYLEIMDRFCGEVQGYLHPHEIIAIIDKFPNGGYLNQEEE